MLSSAMRLSSRAAASVASSAARPSARTASSACWLSARAAAMPASSATRPSARGRGDAGVALRFEPGELGA
jgi:hypothetical protein